MANVNKKLESARNSARQLINKTPLGFTTQRDYKRILEHCIGSLHKQGYIIDNVNQLKQKHIHFLVDKWKKEALSTRTIKNKLSVLRVACENLRKPHVVLGNENYQLVSHKKAHQQRAIFDLNLSEFPDKYVRCAVALQQAFGLRREEAIKFNAGLADKGHYIELRPSWTKGGIGRDVPVTTREQRELLNEIKQVFGKSNLIPPHLSYIQQRTHYDNAVKNSSYHNLHGLRYAYAQNRYQALTGWLAPANGGRASKDMPAEEKAISREARLMISREMGHSRLNITKTYGLW